MRIRAVTTPYDITTEYGWVKGYPLNNGFHSGVDYVTGDKKILAPQDAKVTGKGFDSVNGNYLVLEANGYRDWFSHLSSYVVGLGDTVKQGQLVGYMGKTGAADGTHLHHSLRVNGVMVDPEQHITKEEEVEKINEGDLINLYPWLIGRGPNENDKTAWIGKSFKDFVYDAVNRPDFVGKRPTSDAQAKLDAIKKIIG